MINHRGTRQEKKKIPTGRIRGEADPEKLRLKRLRNRILQHMIGCKNKIIRRRITGIVIVRDYG